MSTIKRFTILNSGKNLNRRRYGTTFAALLLSGMMVLGMHCGSTVAATLDDISFTSLPGDRVQILMKLSEPVAEPLSFTIDNPARIALDLPGTTLNLENRSQTIGVGNAESITAVEAEDRTRVVVNMAQLVPYEIETRDNTIRITLDGTPSTLETQVVVK